MEITKDNLVNFEERRNKRLREKGVQIHKFYFENADPLASFDSAWEEFDEKYNPFNPNLSQVRRDILNRRVNICEKKGFSFQGGKLSCEWNYGEPPPLLAAPVVQDPRALDVEVKWAQSVDFGIIRYAERTQEHTRLLELHVQKAPISNGKRNIIRFRKKG